MRQLLSLLKSHIKNHPAAGVGHPSQYCMEEIWDQLSTQPEGAPTWSRQEVVAAWPLVEEGISGEDCRIKKFYVTSNQATCLMLKWEPVVLPDSNQTVNYTPGGVLMPSASPAGPGSVGGSAVKIRHIHPDMPKNPIYAKTGLSYD